MTGGRILVVDDQPDIRLLVRSWLGCEGFHVQAVGSGEAALAALRDGTRPDLIVLDNELGEARRGVDLAPLLKQLSPSTRVVMFSAAIDTGTPVEGADAALNKSEPIERLGALVKSLVVANPVHAA